eukprot:CAMPEP_0202478088 /NCGR_PEP_ID=MMETSP1360-20130828/94276_1 /ASSEMBLY_ACC=CAM_ASM_000848 /TAXON_ID=515479 /ORGANISM="Licmophora paradoxa, Strain CCMP2313" /LENGTH=132 /DNA_ID=CAMNT_0049105351 /DNA_START=114 /DNA_END=512 /DNA_ORIENTATION=+
MAAITQLLNYLASHPNAVVQFHTSEMTLHTDSDASYLSRPKGRSRAAGYFYLSDKPLYPNKPPEPEAKLPKQNGPISICPNILCKVLSSTAEMEHAALFHNGKEACPMRIAHKEMGHSQPPTPIAVKGKKSK